MTLDPQTQALLDAMGESGAEPLWKGTAEQARIVPAGLQAMIGPGPDLYDVRELQIPSATATGIPARLYVPTEETPRATIVYFHGGGWVIATIDTFDAMCRALAVQTGCQVVSIGYRLAPEHRFPAAVDDAYDATVWVAAHLAASDRLIVLGDSSGGNLAAVVALQARDQGGPAIALQVLAYPVTDHDFSTPSYDHYAEGYMLGREDMRWFWSHYVPCESDRSNPKASPLRAEQLAGLPPAYIIVAEYDPLRDEGLAYARRLEAAGVPTHLMHYDDQTHGFFPLVNVLTAADRAVGEVAAFIVKFL